MSDNTPLLTVAILLEELKEVTDWRMLGAYLNVPVHVLDKINIEHNGIVEHCKMYMLQYWLNTTMTASWKNIASALEHLNMLTLAGRLKSKYLWTSLATLADVTDDKKGVSASSSIAATITSSPPPSPSESNSDDLTSVSKAEIEADGKIVRQLRDLVSDYSLMLTDFREQLDGCNVSRAQFFLNKLFDTDVFTSCDSIDKILNQLCHRDIDTFNVYYLHQLATCLKRDDLKKLVNEYEEKKKKFFDCTTVLDFQKAVVSKTKPSLPNGMVEVAIKIPKHLATEKILRDMEKLAMEAFGDKQKSFVCFHAFPGSIVICWFVVESLCEVLQQLAQEKVAVQVWRQHGVKEVMVGSQCVYHYTDQDEEAAKQTALEQECVALKKVYREFYHQLVDVLSDGDTHHSIVSNLHKRSVISEKVWTTQMTSTVQKRGRSLLTVLSLEEKPHKLRELITVMMEVEKVKSLAEEMTAQLSKLSEQEQQQFEARIVQLTSDKKDLLTQLQYYEEKLKAANELSMMREKVISSMMAVVKGPEINLKMIAEQHETVMADLNTKLKNTEKKLQSANILLATQESELKEMRRRVGDLKKLLSDHFPLSLVQVTGERKHVAVLKQETTIQLSISSQDILMLPFPIEQLSCQLTYSKSQHVPCHITHTQPGVCTLTFTPILLCPHQLKITIRGTDIPGSPFIIYVILPPMMRMAPENRSVVQGTIHGVKYPIGVAVSSSGEVVVSECFGHRISVYTMEGKYIRSFGSQGSNMGQFLYPYGVAITSDNHILLADRHNRRIQMFTMDGKIMKSVGKYGHEQLQFDYPSGIAVHPSGKVFVADTYNHRIQVLNPDLSYSHMFGSKGSAPGQFSCPYGVAIDSSGVVYVTDTGNDRMQLFSAEGQFISIFDSEKSHGQLNHPLGICIDSTNTVYVTDRNHRVSVYTSSGQFIKCFGSQGSGEGQFGYPNGVTVDNTTGALYVCDSQNHRVVVY